jgi:hypothetical protein
MITRAGAAVVLAVLSATPAAAQDGSVLGEDALKAEFAGKTITGYYLDTKVGFVEAYRADGRITYKDDLQADLGRWWVTGQLFCTFYDRISGGCWYVRKVNANCLEFFPQSTGLPLLPPSEQLALRPDARAAREGEKVTCEAWLGS